MLDGDVTGNLVVRAEPRLQLGVFDPSDEINVPGSTTSWMLSSPATIGPSVILGGLGGPPRPQLRTYDLAGPGWAAGVWGMGWEVKLDVGACLLDPRATFSF